jgi:hypothetical protein
VAGSENIKDQTKRCSCAACMEWHNPAHDSVIKDSGAKSSYLLSVYQASLFAPEPVTLPSYANRATIWLSLFEVRE